MQLKDSIEKFHNVKKFSLKKPDWRDIIECIDYARFAPMAGDNFTLKFILVDDKNIIDRLAKHSEQDFIADVSYLIVVCSNPSRTITLYKDRGKNYAQYQAGAAIQNLILALTEKKLSTYWVRHFGDKLIKNELKIPADLDVVALLPIGYEFGKTKTKESINLNNIMYFGKWGNSKMNPLKGLDA